MKDAEFAEIRYSGPAARFLRGFRAIYLGLPMITFFVYIAVKWWVIWRPGTDPGGGGYIAQRIFSSNDEKTHYWRRFLFQDSDEKHNVVISQVGTLILMLLSAVVTFYLSSIGKAWQFLIALGAGTGLVYILRWFWWRINAWSEVSAMIAAFITSIVIEYGFHLDDSQPVHFAHLVLWTVCITTLAWFIVTLLTQTEDMQVLLNFYRKIRPNASLWGPVAKAAPEVQNDKDGLFQPSRLTEQRSDGLLLPFWDGISNPGTILSGIGTIRCGIYFRSDYLPRFEQSRLGDIRTIITTRCSSNLIDGCHA